MKITAIFLALATLSPTPERTIAAAKFRLELAAQRFQATQDPSATRTAMMKGIVNGDEKSFFDGTNEKTWKVTNPEVIKGLAGRIVRIKCEVNDGRNEIAILSLKVEKEKSIPARR